METLCLEAGTSAEEYQKALKAVTTTLRQWKRFAQEAQVPTLLQSEVEQRLERMRREVSSRRHIEGR